MNINLTPLLKSIFDYDPDGPNMCKTAGGAWLQPAYRADGKRG